MHKTIKQAANDIAVRYGVKTEVVLEAATDEIKVVFFDGKRYAVTYITPDMRTAEVADYMVRTAAKLKDYGAEAIS